MTSPFDEQDVTPENKENKEKETVTEKTTQSKIVTTLKGGSGFNAPWTVIHSDTLEEAVETLENKLVQKLLDLTKEVGEYYGGPVKVEQSNGKPEGATKAPDGREAPEGYVFRSGVGKNGKPWKAFLPKDKQSGLEPIWLNN